MNNIINRTILDATVWSVSLLFAFGLLLNAALTDARGPSASSATWSTVRVDFDEHTVRISG